MNTLCFLKSVPDCFIGPFADKQVEQVECWQMDGQTDGRYQMYYLPALQAINTEQSP